MKDQRRRDTLKDDVLLAGGELVDYVKRLLAQGNVRRLVFRKPDGEVLLEVPLGAGIAVGGAVTLLAPVLAALGAMGALLAQVRVEIIRRDDSGGGPR